MKDAIIRHLATNQSFCIQPGGMGKGFIRQSHHHRPSSGNQERKKTLAQLCKIVVLLDCETQISMDTLRCNLLRRLVYSQLIAQRSLPTFPKWSFYIFLFTKNIVVIINIYADIENNVLIVKLFLKNTYLNIILIPRILKKSQKKQQKLCHNFLIDGIKEKKRVTSIYRPATTTENAYRRRYI